MGFAYAPLSLTVLREAPPESQGAATAGLQLSDVLGTSLGSGVGGALIAFGHREGAEPWVGLAWAFGIGVAAALFGVVLAGRLTAWKPTAETTPSVDATPHDAASATSSAAAATGQRTDPTR
jgi:MFS family permease